MSIETAKDIIDSALLKLGVKNASVSLTDEELERGLDNLHLLFNHLESLGFTFKMSYVDDATKVITLDESARMAVIYNLAILLADEYSIEPSITMARLAQTSLSAIRRSEVTQLSLNFPSTMPIGSGNSVWGADYNYYHYNNDNLTKQNTNLNNKEGCDLLITIPSNSCKVSNV